MIERLSLMIGRVAALSLEDLRREDGQTTVEYAIVLVLVIIMATAAFTALGVSVDGAMTAIGTKISGLITALK